MAFLRAELYALVADHLKESSANVLAGVPHPTAKKVALHEIGAAEYVLAQHPWNFASETRRLELAATADPSDPDSDPIGWAYAYAKGAVLRINWVSRTGKQRDRLTRAGEWDDKGGRILSNVNPLYLDGVRQVFATEAKIGSWPRLFGVAVASVIADWAAGPVTNSRGVQQDVSMRSHALIEEAHVWDAQQAPPPPRRTGSWNRGRFRGAARFSSGEL